MLVDVAHHVPDHPEGTRVDELRDVDRRLPGRGLGRDEDHGDLVVDYSYRLDALLVGDVEHRLGQVEDRAVDALHLEDHSVYLDLDLRIEGGGEDLPRSEEHTSELQSQSNIVCR